MFHFPRDDNLAHERAGGGGTIYRMTSLRHNPYVGSFHGKILNVEDTTNLSVNLMLESKSNPLIGSFRHSPIARPNSLGLKRILYQNFEAKPTVLSQLQVPREPKNVPIKRSFLKSLKTIPVKVFSASSLASKSSISASAELDPEPPVCSICIEPYVDGDELNSLACSHCFHTECVQKWFFQGCLNNVESASFSCPVCRQDHEQLSQHEVNTDCGEEISSASFFHVGQTLIAEGGYDFMSDVGSDTTRTAVSVKQQLQQHTVVLDLKPQQEVVSELPATATPPSPMNIYPPKESTRSRKLLGESTYSDCGVPL